MKAKVLPIVVGTLGTLRKDFAKGVELIPGRPKVSEIQKIALLLLTFYGSAPDSSFTGWKAERNNVKIP